MDTTKVLTIETRLNQRDNAELIEYTRGFSPLYCKALRFAWHRYNNGGRFDRKQADFNALLQHKFGLSKRVANSVIHEVKGLYKALYQLKWYEVGQLKGKIDKAFKKREKLSEKVFAIKQKYPNGQFPPSALRYYRRQKQKIFYTNQKINRLIQKKKNLLDEIKSKDLSVCFGTKKLFYAQFNLKENSLTSHEVWLEHFRQARDNRCLFVGDRTELRGNQLMQLTPLVNATKGSAFVIQLRKNTKEFCHVRGVCTFKHMDGALANDIIKRNHGVTYRILFRGRKCYLQAMITLERDKQNCKTRSSYGTIGLDYNDGFIEMAETNEIGNLIKTSHVSLKYHGTGKKAENEVRQTVSQIVDYAISVGKDIVIEDLDFRKAKSKAEKASSDKGKEYNKMIHAFDYSRYKKTFEVCCFKRDANLIEVNPAYTSKIAEQKYCSRKKLSVHQGASFVIARKGQGVVDKYIKPKTRRKKKVA